MRRRAFRIRRWLALAVAFSALVIASGAQARLYGGEDQGRASGGTDVIVSSKSAPTVSTRTGFDWGYAIAGVGVGLVVVISGLGLLQLGRNRRRLATLL